jgi:DNA-binding NtrC family response regulator
MNGDSSHKQDPDKPGTGTTVLLVDDEDCVLRVVSRLMQRSGFTVLTATNGRTAVDLFRAAKDEIHAVVVDMTMPGMDGETVCREILGIKPGVAIIFASGFAGAEVAARFAPGEIAGFIQKPYSHELLVKMIRDALDG